MYSENHSYTPVCSSTVTHLQRNQYRKLYDTSELVTNMLNKDYISDEEILRNRDSETNNIPLDRKQNKRMRKQSKW